MSRLIDADELKAVYISSEIEGFEKMMVPVEVAIQNIDDMPPVDAVPVTWIEGEIKWLKEMDNPFAIMSAGQIEAMLKRWKDGDEHG